MRKPTGRNLTTKSYRLSAVLICATLTVASGLAALRQNGPHDKAKKEMADATIVRVGVMSEREKEHSKLYKGSGGRNLIKGNRAIHIVIPPPFIGGDDEEEVAPTLGASLKRSACGADAVVVGVVTSKTSQLTESGNFVFSDYDLRLEEVIKSAAVNPLGQGTNIVVTRAGGVVNLDGKIIEVTDRSYLPLAVGGRYLLFLQQVPATGAYRTRGSDDSFELKQNQVRRLSGRQFPYALAPADPNSFLSQVYAAVSSCEGKGGAK